MALTGPPLTLQSGSHSAAKFRQMLASLIIQSGVFANNDLKVTQRASAGQGVLVASGGIGLKGSSSTIQGVYYDFNDASQDVPATAADGAQTRIDRIIYRVRDPDFVAETPPAAFEYLQGTAGAGSPPTVPADSVALAQISRPPNNNVITDSQIADERKFAVASGGIITCTSTTRPSNRPVGQMVVEIDTGQISVWNGTVWVPWYPSTQSLKPLGWGPGTVGSPPNVNSGPFYFQAGDTVVTTTSVGGFSIVYPTPFPNGVIAALCQSGDDYNNQAAILQTLQNNQTRDQMNGRLYSPGGFIGNATLHVNWLAIGW